MSDRSPFFLTHSPSRILYIVALAGMVIATGFTKVMDFDIWWHLKTGEVIWATGALPTTDIFSYTRPGAAWVNHEWLFQVVAWLIHAASGTTGLILMKGILTTLVTVLFYKTLSLVTSSRNIVLWGTFFMLVAISDRIFERPHLFSMLFLAYFLWRLLSYERGRSRWLWDLVLLEVLWANVHGEAILGPQLILAFAAGETLQVWLGGEDPIPSDRRRHLWLAGLATVAAACLNPAGIDILLFALSHVKMDTILLFTQEWMPALDPELDGAVTMILFRLLLVMVLISFLLNRKNARLSHLLLTALTGYLMLQGRRFTAEFALVNIPILVCNLRALATRFALTPSLVHARAWVCIAGVTILGVAAIPQGGWSSLKGHAQGEVGLGTYEFMVPARMVDFLEREHIHGRVFNEMGIGGYLIFRRWPGERVFIDGRTPVYGDDFFRDYVDVGQTSANFEKLRALYRFDYLVFKADQALNMLYLHKYLMGHPAWALVYADPMQGYVYLQRNAAFADVIRRNVIREHPLFAGAESATVPFEAPGQ